MSGGGDCSDKRMELGRCPSVRGEMKAAGGEGVGSAWKSGWKVELELVFLICQAKKQGFWSTGKGVRLPGYFFFKKESDIVRFVSFINRKVTVWKPDRRQRGKLGRNCKWSWKPRTVVFKLWVTTHECILKWYSWLTPASRKNRLKCKRKY